MKRINSLQALRAFAFLSIVAAHCGWPYVRGAMGVSVFFMLSGFCFAINYIPKVNTLPTSFAGCVRFSVSKIGKLYVLHLLMIAYKECKTNPQHPLQCSTCPWRGILKTTTTL